ncbi:hypothetical protein SAMN02745885_01620 [Carboxydocella sporoproducens DSM 16521]|uniref:Uncharacterized protein n=2 Tax=Carboxydocella TaxID=178898 RepID=A0A1T4QF14_9FIRM|nr:MULTISPECIES: DUF6011 domain-containing protein [Carboxydocella]AVX21631.1 hypothetical protein CFE_2488 [Carboxydocella thermautotrophica]SKA01808.1 hypothetical protein SAMN02745885_01620 [Carboxydocella sporoproducens DSM 16521]
MKCGACGRTLKDEKSIKLGYGKTCYKKLFKGEVKKQEGQEDNLLVDFVAELVGWRG